MPASNSSTITYYSPLQFVGTVTAGTINATSVITSGPATYNNLTANSAVATDGSKNLVSVTNTGSGNNVLANTPTLITPILGVASGTSLSLSSTASATQYTSTITTGTAPLVIASTTNVANLNASLLNGATFASPGPVGSTTASTGAFTTLSTSGLLTAGAGLTSTAATNNFGATTMSGAIAMGTNKITGLGYPTLSTDAASKLYVDTVSQGLDAKDSVRAATIANGDLATAYENGDIIDGVALATGNRILLKNQTNPIENGIYVVAASGAPTRAADFAAASTPTGAYTFVEEGTVNISAGFVSTAPSGTNTVETHAMPFTQFSGAGQIIAGTGLTKTGNILSVNASQTQITSVGTLTALTVTPGTASMAAGTFSTTLDVTGITTLRNTLEIVGATTGVISIKAQAAAGTFNFNLPTTAGSSSDVLTSAGGAGAPMTWSATNGTGNVVRTTSATLVTPVLGAATGTSLQLSGLTASQAVATDASKNLISVATTGTGNYVLQTSPTLITPVLGAATGTSLNLSGLTASQAVATDASKNLVSVATTGTGSYVLANTPTLITPVLGAATGTSLNLSGLTASQVVVTDGSKNLASLGYSATPTASFIVSYDSSKNITANNLIGQSTTTATAAGTTILTVASTLNQIFTGSTTQIVQLPDGTTVPVGWQVNIINRSTQDVSVVDAGSNAVATVFAGKSQQLILSVSSTNGTWALLGAGSVTSVAATVPSFLSISGSPITSSGTLAITYSGTALPITSGGTGSTTATGTGSVVLANTPTLITPVLGVASGTSLSLSSTASATQYTSTISTGTAPFVVSSTTNVANLNASTLSGATFASPGSIGSTTAGSGAFTTLTTSGITTLGATNSLVTVNGGIQINSTGGLPANPSGVGVCLYYDANGFANVQLNGSGDATGGGLIDFSSSATDYKGRIIYTNSNNLMEIHTNGSQRISINSTRADITMTTASTTTTTGALTVAGGVGIAGALFGTTASFSTIAASGLITANAGLTVASGTTTLGASSIGAITGTSATFSGVVTANGTIAMGGQKITGLGYPTATTDAASKLYVDNVALGLDAKDSVRVATTTAGTLVSSFENGDIIDGVVLVTGNRILIKDQANPIENGIYVVAASGSPTHSTDFAEGSTPTGAFTYVEEGNVNSSAGFVSTAPSGTNTVGTHAMTFTQFSGAGSITAGTGLTKTGNTLSVNASQTQITTVGTLTALSVTGNITNAALTASQAVATDASKNLISVATTGTGNYVLQTSPTLITPTLGAAVGTSLQLSGLTASQAVATDASKNLISVATTGSGSYVLANTPTLITPVLGAATGTSLNLSGLTASQAVATDSSKNLVSVATTGTGNYVLANTPTLITPVLGAATGTSLNLSGLTASQVVVTDGSKNLASLGYSATPTASFIVSYDSSKNITANNLIGQSTTTATAAGTTILTVASTLNQIFTGTTTQIVQLPDGTTVPVGWQVNIINRSTQDVSVVDAGSNAVATVYAGKSQQLILSVSSTNGTWALLGAGSVTSVAATVPSFLSISGSPITSSGTLAITYSGTALPITSGGTGSTTATGTGSVVLANTPTLITPVLGAATGTSLQLSGLTASQAVATDASKNLVSVATTGTGNYVLSASPTLTGTIIAAAATLSGVLTSSNTTASTSNATGSVLLSGGLGISNATDATSATNGGSITTAGGLAVAKKAYFGDNAVVSGGIYVSGAISPTTSEGVYIGSNSIQLNAADTNGNTIIDFSFSGQDFLGRILYDNNGDYFNFYTNEVNRMQILTTGVNIIPTTASTTTTTGALTVAGGVGVAGALFGTTASFSTIAASGLVSANLGLTVTGANTSVTTLSASGLVSANLGLTVTGANTSVTSLSASGLVSANLGLTVTGANTSVTTLSASGLVTTNAGIALTGDLTMAGSSSGIVSIKTQAAAGTFNFNLPITAGTTGQVLASAGGASSPMTWKTVLSSSQSTFGGAQSATNASITGLVFTSGSFETNVIVDVVATTNLTQVFKLSGVLSGGASNWNLTAVGVSGEATSVTFTITAGGQIQYSSTAYAGFVSLTFTWTDYINASGLLNLTSGVNVSKVISGTDGPLFNVSGATVTDSGTANSGTLALFSANYIGRPTIAATGTSVTTTQANTVFIAGEPIAGTNETITSKHALKVGTGGKIGMDGSTSGTVSITTQAAAGTFNFNLPVTAGSSGQVLASAGGASSPMTWVNVVTSAATPGSFAGANNQSSAANITGLVFASGYFKIDVIVTVVATTNLTEYFVVYGVLSNNTGTGWALTSTSVAGDVSGSAITINSSGQLLYTSANHSGFTSINFAWA